MSEHVSSSRLEPLRPESERAPSGSASRFAASASGMGSASEGLWAPELASDFPSRDEGPLAVPRAPHALEVRGLSVRHQRQ